LYCRYFKQLLQEKTSYRVVDGETVVEQVEQVVVEMEDLLVQVPEELDRLILVVVVVDQQEIRLDQQEMVEMVVPVL
jgi:hypothetical protein